MSIQLSLENHPVHVDAREPVGATIELNLTPVLSLQLQDEIFPFFYSVYGTKGCWSCRSQGSQEKDIARASHPYVESEETKQGDRQLPVKTTLRAGHLPCIRSTRVPSPALHHQESALCTEHSDPLNPEHCRVLPKTRLKLKKKN